MWWLIGLAFLGGLWGFGSRRTTVNNYNETYRRHSRRRWQRCDSRPGTPTKGVGIEDWDRGLVIFLEPDLNVAPARGSTGALLDTGRVKRRSVSTIAAI